MNVDIAVLPHAEGLPLPAYATEDSAGMDLLAAITEDLVILPHKTALIKTGITIALPKGYEAQVRPRSGLALKHSITVLNTPGTIDADYRGEVGVILINHGEDKFVVTRGMRIAQMIIAPYTRAQWNVVSTLEESARGAGGFGSTGNKSSDIGMIIQLHKRMFYAIEAVLYIAYNSTGNCVSSKEIAEKQKMLPRYLEQIMQRLVKVGILKGVRGPAGGYLLAREKRRITVADICRAMHEEEPMHSSMPLGDKIVLPIIRQFQENIILQMENITISDLCQQATEKNIRKTMKETTNFII